ncbi:glycosyltransferase [Rhodococcus phenolicus]|uniref:glycosyltransferase n=1 Tax=Rhodococcus phenolicus TaxID=263849 RepID=UPI00082C171F|nr:glycosyltransferase [Rhodococcus phenolicus]
MRVLQVVTMLSRDGAYGGPARVALNQSAELLGRGDDVTVVAATRDYPLGPSWIDGVPVRLFNARQLVPGSGFAGLGAPAMTRWVGRNRTRFDVVHIHFGRDLVVLPVAVTMRRSGIPYVLQTHGMVGPSDHPLAAPLDAALTRRVLRGAGAVFYLNAPEREQIGAVARTVLPFVQLRNGVPTYRGTAVRPGPPEVLFVARMHPRKRPVAFVEMAKALLAKGVEARFTLVGPDEGEGSAIRAALSGDTRISWEGALAPVAIPQRMAAASLYVLPSVREPFPMSVLEAMSVGLPVVITNGCGLASVVERTASGIVTDPAVPALAAAVESVLAEHELARAMGERGRAVAHADFGMQPVAERLQDVYSRLLGSGP